MGRKEDNFCRWHDVAYRKDSTEGLITLVNRFNKNNIIENWQTPIKPIINFLQNKSQITMISISCKNNLEKDKSIKYDI